MPSRFELLKDADTPNPEVPPSGPLNIPLERVFADMLPHVVQVNPRARMLITDDPKHPSQNESVRSVGRNIILVGTDEEDDKAINALVMRQGPIFERTRTVYLNSGFPPGLTMYEGFVVTAFDSLAQRTGLQRRMEEVREAGILKRMPVGGDSLWDVVHNSHQVMDAAMKFPELYSSFMDDLVKACEASPDVRLPKDALLVQVYDLSYEVHDMSALLRAFERCFHERLVFVIQQNEHLTRRAIESKYGTYMDKREARSNASYDLRLYNRAYTSRKR